VTVRIDGIEFDRASYDAEVDVLYLHVGDPGDAVDFDASSEGHALRYDARDSLVGITVLNARWNLKQSGSVVITTPGGRLMATPEQLAPALVSRAA
jgi:YD repeat-containing protein